MGVPSSMLLHCVFPPFSLCHAVIGLGGVWVRKGKRGRGCRSSLYLGLSSEPRQKSLFFHTGVSWPPHSKLLKPKIAHWQSLHTKLGVFLTRLWHKCQRLDLSTPLTVALGSLLVPYSKTGLRGGLPRPPHFWRYGLNYNQHRNNCWKYWRENTFCPPILSPFFFFFLSWQGSNFCSQFTDVREKQYL